MSVESFLPDPTTYTLVINDRMRRLLQQAVSSLIDARADDQDAEDMEEQQRDDEVLDSMADMLNPEGSTGPLVLSPCVNSFVL